MTTVYNFLYGHLLHSIRHKNKLFSVLWPPVEKTKVMKIQTFIFSDFMGTRNTYILVS